MTALTFDKNMDYFHRRADSLETKPELLTDFITPNEQFFVCKATNSPMVDLATFTLKVRGDGIGRPLALSYEALLKLPSYTVISYLECAGNHRDLFDRIMNRPVAQSEDGFGMTKWVTGGVGNAVWTGVSLRTLLEMAELDPETVEVNAKGLDQDAPEGGVNRPIPIEKALDPNTLVAYHMNGEPLPLDNGYPLRLIVPGWVGTNSIKWLGELIASKVTVQVDRNTKHYVFIGPEWTPDGEVLGEVITTQNIKSSLALAWDAPLQAGKQVIRGNARSPLAPIAHVEWSADSGETWQAATLIPPNLKHSWCRFEFEWDAPAGAQTLMTRATDTDGNTQPMTQPFNAEGYLFNRVFPHPVTVSTL
ncbi:MAG: molybdopterin-dependent oxidoreductase [Candidatus Promineifilaceae bacterium]